MKKDKRDTKFENIIREALKTGGTQEFPPFKIFQAAIGDLAGDFPKEKTFLLKLADEQYYDLCKKAADSLWEGNAGGTGIASQYLQDKYVVENEWSEYITWSMAYAFAEHKYGAKVAAPVKQAEEKEHDASKPASKPKPANKPKSANKPKPAAAPQKSSVGTVDQSAGNAKPKGIIKPIIISIIVLLAAVSFVVRIDGGLNFESVDAGEDTTYMIDGVAFTLPGTYEASYFFSSPDDDGSDYLSTSKESYDEDSIEEHWKQEVDYYESREDSNIESGEQEIDGETCYWISNLDGDLPEKVLYMPQGDQHYVELSFRGDTEVDTSEFFDDLVKGIHYTRNLDNTDSYSGGLGVSITNGERWRLSRCSYELWLGNSNLEVECALSDIENGSGLNEVYNEELEFTTSSYAVYEQGEIKIEGTKGYWYDYSIKYGLGHKDYCYTLFFEHKGKVVNMVYKFSGGRRHFWFHASEGLSKEIQKINDSIHFEDE